jgi:uncharacterized protein
MPETRRTKAAIELTLLLGGIFILWSVRAIYGYAYDASIASETLRALYGNVVKGVLWVVPAFGFARWARHSKPVRYLGISVMPTARQWSWCLGVIGLFVLAVIGFETLQGGKSLARSGIPFSITTVGVLFYVVSPVLEEILFRGLVLKELGSLMPGGIANLVTSLLFVGIHLPYWLSHGGVTPGMISNCVGIFAFSLVAGWLYLRSASIWPPVCAHLANNLVASLLKST